MAIHGLDRDDETPVFVISVAAQLAGLHAQTLRQYDRLGLVTPSRTRGGGRRYSARGVARLRDVQRLSHEGVGPEGIQGILHLENQVAALEARVDELARALQIAEMATGRRVFAVGRAGETIVIRPGQRPPHTASQAVVMWEPMGRAARQ